jgi:hypothetical protein
VPRIDLGTAVRVRIVGRDRCRRWAEGVVVEVVPACCECGSAAAVPPAHSGGQKAAETEPARHIRFVVQCERVQVLVRPNDLLVDAW